MADNNDHDAADGGASAAQALALLPDDVKARVEVLRGIDVSRSWPARWPL